MQRSPSANWRWAVPACLCAAVLLAKPSLCAPAKEDQITGFTLHVSNGSLPPQYAHQEELRGQVTPHSVYATYTFTHYVPNKGKSGYREAVTTWRGALPPDEMKQFQALARNVVFEKPRKGPPLVGGGVHSLSVTYTGGRQTSGTPTDAAGWDRLLQSVARLAHSPKKG